MLCPECGIVVAPGPFRETHKEAPKGALRATQEPSGAGRLYRLHTYLRVKLSSIGKSDIIATASL